MVEERKPLTFGPSERYLPAIQEGDALTFVLNNSGKDVDTEWGSKIQFSVTVLTVQSSLDIKPGDYLWNTSCSAAKELFKYLNTQVEEPNEVIKFIGKLKLNRTEHGYTITEDF
jgi:hypothetical protein